MKTLYITSVEPHSGKTAVCLALGKQLQSDGYKVGYLKPVSTQPWRTPEGKLVDQDAVFVQRMLELKEDPSILSPVVITSSTLRSCLTTGPQADYRKLIRDAAAKAGDGKDVLLLEGGSNLREGHALDLSIPSLAKDFAAPAMAVIRYQNDIQILDDSLSAKFRLSDQLSCILLNHIPVESEAFIKDIVIPCLEKEGICVHGALPKKPRLSAISIGELTSVLEAELLTKSLNPDILVESFAVGAMTLDAALSRFRHQRNKAVITGGDRADIQLAALETSTVALILTGNLHPSSLVVQQAENLNIPILLVKENTMETVNAVENVWSRTRLAQPEKLDAFINLMEDNAVFDSIYRSLDLKRKNKG
ncbi:MAG: phosphotransacetylase family protein [Anaerolineales bacterium]|nr:phosphotransacetylase family protein [Anaerolineales bacterium]